MIKKLLSTTFLMLTISLFNAQSFNLVYQFSSVSNSPSTGTVDPTPTPTAVGVVSGSFTANGVGTAPTTTNVFAFTGWTTDNTPDLTKYFELILTPASGYGVSINKMTFYVGRSNSGPQKWSVRTNRDGYAANAVGSTSLISPTSSGSIITVNGTNEFVWGTIPTNSATSSSAWRNNCSVSFSGAGYTDQISPYNLRFYGYAAPATGGSFRIDSVVVNGTANLGAGIGQLSHDINAKFQLYPNPTQDGIVSLEVKTSFEKVEVLNILGAVVAKQEGILSEKIQLDLATLPQGTYFVRVISGNSSSTEKLIISK